MKKTRKQRKQRQRRATRKRKTGGANSNSKLNCDAEGFNYSMRLASLGSEYRNPVGHIHADGERWSFDQLVDFTLNGRIVDWYIQQLQNSRIEFTEEDMQRIKNSPELKVMGAFFHRYKVVAERLGVARSNLKKGVQHFLIQDKFKGFKGKNSYKNLLENSTQKLPVPLRKKVEELANLVEREKNFEGIDLPIEMAIDRAQCLIFYIIKHKGVLPSGFVMDPRIEERARTPIEITKEGSDLEMFGPMKIDPTLKWLSFAKGEHDILKEPSVTFGVF